MDKITRLYPQYQMSKDRRQHDIPVAVERRSGKERRSPDRIQMDCQLTKDIFEVKEKVAKIESLAPKLFEANISKQAPTFTSMNNMQNDQLVKERKLKLAEIERQEEKLQDKASLSFQVGIISAALAFSIAISFMSSIGSVIAVTTAAYIGARVLKALVVKEMQDSDKTADPMKINKKN